MPEAVAYQLKNIRHYYENTCALNVDELQIAKGSITGLIGPNGSGKTTLLKLLAFAMPPSCGDIFYNGKKEGCFSPVVRSKITLLTQKPYLLKRSVFENIAYGLKIRKDCRNLDSRIRTALAYVGLDHAQFAQRKWHQLSGGEAQRVAMAARLILKPEVLLLDEPVASVDTQSARLIRTASLNARDQWGTTLVIASHDLQWLYSISDSQLSISNGNIFATGIENIIPGPFEETREKTVIKKLEDGQILTLKKPENKKNTAMIKKDCLRIKEDNGSDNQLSGQIISMLAGEKSSHVLTHICVQELSFTLKLVPDQICRMNLYPGKNIVLQFDSTDVEWI
ncbi:MAG: energy-coupling factor ABC transporter ATP-binding protein [Proteobacteria bacterium]|nr:energy-coupling factor ABC transporter ATP-binding protein [Pseudomonadota bacterium]MBU1388026.1 energy-coupling factor ABC transporter ATP-binding protein [Pseudomonadota bacterium]MBU1542089.1 energy-coupling factor ABC transporter ATP-binding protein [Pseudomonadota bacterium]MBU2482873.1 energy-coupling factor ABC transporter ATP-binding protein [Pseudomonadota bacterium]